MGYEEVKAMCTSAGNPLEKQKAESGREESAPGPE
jgi:hypothetical protein